MSKEKQTPYHTLAVVGLSKNAGKTTVLNGLIQQYARVASLGILSIGVDGEAVDAWSARPKPAIQVPAGTFVATTGVHYEQLPGNWEILKNTRVSSSLGSVFIARALCTTKVKLDGVQRKESIRQVIQMMKSLGVHRILIDGAYDRMAAACTTVADGMIVVIGASLARSLQTVLKKWQEWSHLFQLPRYEDKWATRFQTPENQQSLWIVQNNQAVSLPFSSVLQVSASEESVLLNSSTLFLPGALTNQTLRLFIRQKAGITIVVRDATHLFITLEILRQFYQIGGKLMVLARIPILGIAINPTSPDGYGFDAREMKHKVKAMSGSIPVWDWVHDIEQEVDSDSCS
ncbi:hypothetical protein IC619_008670 [Hazenella sp. IB182353]|uniref:lysine 5,6-aminomutase reactivase subunit KamB n=1 Tax=Polycladospora coralii TaxID=2771432 RepID=UPI0017462881|nr:hypothetical protein [Polycladospora coralii]MBS7530561.1 hypothetical protein [Polycladospora coralii]